MALLLGLVAGSVSAQDTGPIISEGIVNAPIERVWEAWTTSDGLRSWLAPHAEIALGIGGLMRTNYSPEGTLGDPGTIENVILSYEPMGMLSIKVHRTPADFPFPNAVKRMWTNVHFETVYPGRTHVRIVGLGFDETDESRQLRRFFDEGNAYTLKQLQQHFAPGTNGDVKAAPGRARPFAF